MKKSPEFLGGGRSGRKKRKQKKGEVKDRQSFHVDRVDKLFSKICHFFATSPLLVGDGSGKKGEAKKTRRGRKKGADGDGWSFWVWAGAFEVKGFFFSHVKVHLASMRGSVRGLSSFTAHTMHRTGEWLPKWLLFFVGFIVDSCSKGSGVRSETSIFSVWLIYK